MCTALSFKTEDHYFGRNLDLSYSYDEAVVITPRRFPLPFRRMPNMDEHLAMIGMATVMDGYPLYYDATNEAGLSIAGLNFPGNAVYPPETPGKDNVSPFEFIPWIVGQCRTVAEARVLLSRICLADIPFSEQLPLSPLHFMISDKTESIVVESMADGLHVYDNPVHVMTNNPPFPFHMQLLTRYRALASVPSANTLAPQIDLSPCCIGYGALGLPGDWSSESRFIRTAFLRQHAQCSGDEESIGQFFHILGSVRFPRGCVTDEGRPEITVYTSCCNTDKGVYYYTTQENSQITAVNMHAEALDGDALARYPLVRRQQICRQNG